MIIYCQPFARGFLRVSGNCCKRGRAAIFFNKSIQNLHFLCRKMFESLISNLNLFYHFFSFKNMKNNKSSQNPDTDYHYIKYGGPPFPL